MKRTKFKEKLRMWSWEIRKRLINIYRSTEFIALEKNLTTSPELPLPEKTRGTVIFKPGTFEDDLEDIVQNFPDDLGFPLFNSPESITRGEVAYRFRVNIPVFVARDAASGEFLGAFWAVDCSFLDVLPERFAEIKSYKIANLFTVHSARGKGVAQGLMIFAENFMRARGYQHAFSLIRPHLKPSIHCHLRIGFRPFGILKMKTFFKKRSKQFYDKVPNVS